MSLYYVSTDPSPEQCIRECQLLIDALRDPVSRRELLASVGIADHLHAVEPEPQRHEGIVVASVSQGKLGFSASEGGPVLWQA
ncbi:hypothetical protein D9M71_392670 [compost metagenome]